MNTLNNKLLELAKEAGVNIHEYVNDPGTPATVSYEFTAGGLKRFAALLSAAQEEREPTAKFQRMNKGGSGEFVSVEWQITPPDSGNLYLAPPSSDQVWNEAVEAAAKLASVMKQKDLSKYIRSLKRPLQVQEQACMTCLGAGIVPIGDGRSVDACPECNQEPSASGAVDSQPSPEEMCPHCDDPLPAGREQCQACDDFDATGSQPSPVTDDLDFEPDEQHTVADMANVGYSLMQAIKAHRPDYCWNESPAEIVGSLEEELYELSRAQAAQQPLDNIEQYRLQMAAISTAALGYWKLGDPIKEEYVTVALKDVAKLYAKYDELFKAAQQAQPTAIVKIDGASVCLEWASEQAKKTSPGTKLYAAAHPQAAQAKGGGDE